MKIGVKLLTTISIINFIGIGLLAAITLTQAQGEISRLADEQARSVTRENGEKIRNWLEEYMGAARTLAHVMEGYKSIPPEQRRGYFDLMLKQVLIAYPELNDVWANWAPNALDGMDAYYANTPGTDETGRYISSWYYIDGIPRLVAIISFDWDAVLSLHITSEYIIDPAEYIDPLTGEKVLTVVLVAPVRDNDVIVGYVGLTVKAPEIQAMVEQINPFGAGHGMLFSSGGIVAGHRDATRLGKHLRETEADTFGPLLDTMVDAVSAASAASFAYRPDQSDTVYQYYTVPFTIGHVPQAWTLVVGVSRSTIMAPVYRMLTISAIIGLLSIIFMSIGVFFMARSISRPIKRLADMLKDISEGEGEMTKRLVIHRNDEIGEMAASFNTTLDNIQKLIIDIKGKALSLSDLGEDMASSTKEITTTAHEQSASVSEIVSTMEGSKQLSEEMASSTEEVARLSADTQRFSQKGAKLRDANEQMMEDIHHQNGKIIHEIKNLADMIIHINEAIGIIDSIADQTKLIAFNATLEASSSGESGARFSVVAGEIRRFADNVADSTRGIKLKIADIQSASTTLISEALSGSQKIEAGYEHMSAQKAVFESIVETAQNVATRSAQISNLSKQQEYASAQIFETLREISTGVDHFVSATASTSKTAETLNAMSQELQKAIAQYRTSP
ncbi:MAG: methyl-accepting chemotaxis protein [Spirochaetaceae bacterium]|jgi:methyl-accepting chemotaxis protein|nr:methyl-accepting chemotaxis protein [Spirochaetaceae bacterium]